MDNTLLYEKSALFLIFVFFVKLSVLVDSRYQMTLVHYELGIMRMCLLYFSLLQTVNHVFYFISFSL
jgi:hypothetical protein